MSGRRHSQTDREGRELLQLINLVKQPANQQQQLPSIKGVSERGQSQWPHPKGNKVTKGQDGNSSEATALQQFSSKYHAERMFSQHSQHARFQELFSALIQNRLSDSAWMDGASADSVLSMLVCLRILMRDLAYQKCFFHHGGIKHLAEYFTQATSSYLYYGNTPCIVDILKEMTNMFQKLSSILEHQELLVQCGAHKALVLLLSSNDVIVLHCSLLALICLAQSTKPRQQIGELNCVEQLLTIIQDYDNVSKKHATRLLGLLCQELQTRDMIKLHDGVPILLSQLVSDNVNMLYQVVLCIANVCGDQEISITVRQMGGIPLLLALLYDRQFVSERNEASGCASASIHSQTANNEEGFDFASHRKREKTKGDEFMETQYKLKQACCSALAELVLNDTNAQQIAQANGVYCLGLLILPPANSLSQREKKVHCSLQRYAFRTLRFLFSMERNRRLFKKLFPAELYTMFIDIGHYQHDLSVYKCLVATMNSLPADKVDGVRESVMELNQNRAPTHYIKDYAVFEHLGRGAFGSVYKVRRKGAQTFMALKEIDLLNPVFGKAGGERDKSVGDMINELQIMRAGIRHPNVVRYHKTFLEGNTLFIIMDLIEGAPLNEHFNSLKEKRGAFSEARIWHILVQMLLALRYLHKDKGIVHRDLTPNNIMLGENDKVTITDFGLAKMKGTDTSKMTSVCGTILYSCPEMVEGKPYGEKADIWALGCILYQMCVLDPPFFNTNMLTLVKNIVEGQYKAIPDSQYSPKLVNIVTRCICAKASERPDTVQLAGEMCDVILQYMDNFQSSQILLERKLDRERRKTQKHFVAANQTMQKYHRLFQVPKDGYEHLANLAGSGGASGIRNGTTPADSTVDNHVYNTMVINSPEDVELCDWTSDSDSCPSSEYDSQPSRESSAGSYRGATSSRRGQLPPVPTPRAPVTLNRDNYSQQLTVDTSYNSKLSRDSGFGSGDPSPNMGYSPVTVGSGSEMVAGKQRNYSRSMSTPMSEHKKQKPSTKRPKSGSTLTISQRCLRQVSDPISQLLLTLHKIIYISQLPPTLNPNPRRHVIDRFKRALFSPQSSSLELKAELHKLNTGSREVVDLNIGPVTERLNSAGSEVSLGSSRRGSASSLSSTEGLNQTPHQRRRASNSRTRAGSLSRQHAKGAVSGSGTARSSRTSSSPTAGSDSDGSMSSTLKGTETPRGANSMNSTLTSTLKAETQRAFNLDMLYLDREDCITYEQLQSMIETVLVECGYYSSRPQACEITSTVRETVPDSMRSKLLNNNFGELQ